MAAGRHDLEESARVAGERVVKSSMRISGVRAIQGRDEQVFDGHVVMRLSYAVIGVKGRVSARDRILFFRSIIDHPTCLPRHSARFFLCIFLMAEGAYKKCDSKSCSF